MPTDIPQRSKVDRAQFEREILPAGRPVVFKGAVNHWPLVQHRTDSAAAIAGYLRTFNPGTQVEWLAGGPDINGRFFYNDAMDGMNFRRVRGTFADALTLLLTHLADPAPPALALQALSISAHLPRFDLEHRFDLPPPQSQPTMWIGNASTVAAHFDFNDNIACVAHGRRRFMLFPPEQLENLYVGPLEFTPQGVPISLVDAHHPDLARYPRRVCRRSRLRKDHALAGAGGRRVVLGRRLRRPVVAPFHSLLHGVLAIADLPNPQRDIWKKFFDHYVFQVHGDPAQHISHERRGLLGGLSPEQAAQFTVLLAHLVSGTRQSQPGSRP